MKCLQDYLVRYIGDHMQRAIRQFFRAERKRRGLNQETVAERGGIEQSAISKIEIEPAYEPTFPVFEGAVRGLGLTLSEFFVHIEALPPAPSQEENGHPPPISKAVADEASTATPLPPRYETLLERLIQAQAELLTEIGELVDALRAQREHAGATAESDRPTAADRIALPEGSAARPGSTKTSPHEPPKESKRPIVRKRKRL